jgi:hypothetical protein
VIGHGIWRRRPDDLTLLAATVSFAVLGNAFICAVISGPHDRYGARMAWVATFVVLIAAVRFFADEDETDGRSVELGEKVDDARLVDLVADRPHMVPVRDIENR